MVQGANMEKRLSGKCKSAVLAIAFGGALPIWASPTTDDCVAGKGCIQTAAGKGMFEFFAQFDVETHTFQGTVSYSDGNFTVSSDDLYDYAATPREWEDIAS